MQKLWKANVSWDEKVSLRSCDEWNQICKKFNLFSTLRIPRLSGTIGKYSDCQVVVSSDGYLKSYAAAVYLKNGEIIEANFCVFKNAFDCDSISRCKQRTSKERKETCITTT